MSSTIVPRQRIQSIDVLRGLVMVIMALDHVRDFFYKTDITKAGDAALNPTNMQTTFPALFFTRWITHFCAPIFVFLAGTSIYLMCQRKTKREISIFLIKRGFWLVVVELLIITFGWTFDPQYHLLIMQVIWAIGISMIIMGMLVLLPYKWMLALGIIIVAGHNILNYSVVNESLKGGLWADLLYFADFSTYQIFKGHYIIIIYSFVPWLGIMLLGYCFGRFYGSSFDPGKRRKILIQLGTGLIFLFILLRLLNMYGDPAPWHEQPRGTVYTFLSFLNVNKYPPSLIFFAMTLGPGILFLGLIEKVQNRFTGILNIYGRVPMLYYILHFFIIHTLVVITFYVQGFGNDDIITEGVPFFFKPGGLGFGLPGVWAVWIFVVVILFPVCKWYDKYKTVNVRTKPWLSYL
ncbi:MAG TPA: heparan-alpha-glucosaminide N-acetyltransferase domain-containing protein [Chitinophagaceae bacterium]|nr:heparan-alpha-glucosaminide N-acetyltransferase domain-containing protein [Chitinophagaceae bacterium]